MQIVYICGLKILKVTFNIKEMFSITLILFAVIDVLGSIPVFVDLKTKVGKIQSGKATITAGALMVLFLFLGENLLNLIGIDLASFALAGSLVIFLIALELILGVHIFKTENISANAASVVPIAFPLLAGAGTLTTLLSLKTEYAYENILVAILVNLAFIYVVLKFVPWLERKLGQGGIEVLRRVFGIILLALAIKLFKANWIV